MPEARSGAETIVVLGSYAPSLVGFRGPLIADLVGRGHRVVAMAPDIPERIADQLRGIGAEPVSVSLSNTSLNPLEMYRSFRGLLSAIRRVRPTTLIPYTVKPATLGVLAASAAGVPRIIPMITGLGFAFGEGKGARRRLARAVAGHLYRLAMRRSMLVVFQNPDDRADFRRWKILSPGTSSIVVPGSGVDLDKFPVLPLPEAPAFVMVARLLIDKGVREYAAAAKRLRASYPEARFYLAGDIEESSAGITRDELDRMQNEGVDYLGQLDDVRDALSKASVFVLPSRYREGVPRSALEAMSSGRAVITCDTPGCRETVEEGVNGFLVPPGDADALADAMERFVAEPSLAERMGAASRAKAESTFDVRRVNAQLISAAGL